MNTVIIRPQNDILRKYVAYFLFFNKEDDQALSYTTFPNNNLCLAIYKQNTINYINHKEANHCLITEGKKPFSSRLYGFHNRPFEVEISTPLDQVCILFHPSALRAFTGEPYHTLMGTDAAAEALFPGIKASAWERVFDTRDFALRTQLLETLLLQHLKHDIPLKLQEALWQISSHFSENLTIETLSQKLAVSDTTLFRLFKNHLGQNPKSYLKTVRFRKGLHSLLYSKTTMTAAAYLNDYYDQAHFINDFKAFAGCTPRRLSAKIAVSQKDLVWIFQKEGLHE